MNWASSFIWFRFCIKHKRTLCWVCIHAALYFQISMGERTVGPPTQTHISIRDGAGGCVGVPERVMDWGMSKRVERANGEGVWDRWRPLTCHGLPTAPTKPHVNSKKEPVGLWKSVQRWRTLWPWRCRSEVTSQTSVHASEDTPSMGLEDQQDQRMFLLPSGVQKWKQH